MESNKGFFRGSNGFFQPFQVAKIYGTMDDLRLENERVQDGQMVFFGGDVKRLGSCLWRV